VFVPCETKRVFEWIRTGQKTIELRNWNRRGDKATFLCGRGVARGRIVKRERGELTKVLGEDNFKKVIPIANSLKDALDYVRKLYGTTEGTFTAFHFQKVEVF